MFKLFKSAQSHSLTNYLKTPIFLIPTSLFHNPTNSHDPDSKLGFKLNEAANLKLSNPNEHESGQIDDEALEISDKTVVRISHPWPEWVELMERLLKKGYFQPDPFRNGEMGAKDSNRIRTACLNFGRDRFDLIRYFSRKDIQVIVGYGCPSLDRKVVNSGKRLRAHVGLAEGNVCSSCNLRGDCDRAYVKPREDEGGRTVDVMRILLTYGLDPFIGSVENKSCQNKNSKESVKMLLKQMVNLSVKEIDSSDIPDATTLRRNLSVMKQSSLPVKKHIEVPMKPGDWICPKCEFINFARNIRCLGCDGLFKERLMKLGNDQDHLPLKKGDWICDKCNFLNFAKNTRCLQCKENPPKRQLNPGEWECDSCNYINFRRNMVCLKCDHRRPKASNILDSTQTGEKLAQDRTDGRTDNRRANMWRFVDDDSYDHSNSNSYISDDSTGSLDFPIKGGKTVLSQSKQKRENLKSKMVDDSSEDSKIEFENGNEFNTPLNGRPEFMESSDDEEFAEWFGRRTRR